MKPTIDPFGNENRSGPRSMVSWSLRGNQEEVGIVSKEVVVHNRVGSGVRCLGRRDWFDFCVAEMPHGMCPHPKWYGSGKKGHGFRFGFNSSGRSQTLLRAYCT